MRPGAWLLSLSLLLPLLATAREPSSDFPSRKRTVVLSGRGAQGPALEVHVAAGVATLLVFEAPLKAGAPALPAGESRFKLRPVEENEFIVLPVADLAANEQVPLTVDAGADVGPLRLSLVTRAEIDLRVRFVRASDAADGGSAEKMAQQLLDTAEGHPRLVVSQREFRQQHDLAFIQIESVLWMGRRFFVTLCVKGSGWKMQPWQLVQVRLRATLPDGVLQEWSARLLTGDLERRDPLHVFTSLLPANAERLEVAFDGEDSAGSFLPL